MRLLRMNMEEVHLTQEQAIKLVKIKFLYDVVARRCSLHFN